MNEKKLKPSIRFKGFKDDWEQCKLGELGTFKSNGVDKVYRNNDIEVHLINYMDVYNQVNITNSKTNNLMITTASINQIQENNLLTGDILFTPTSETPNDIGNVNVIRENLENTVFSYHLVRYRPSQSSFYYLFPHYSFKTLFIRKQMIKIAQGAQRFVISLKQFENLITYKPNLHEQEKISEFLDRVDNLITLHQRKYEKLVNIKKSMLEKMFADEKNHVPKLRFKGFKDDWEQCELGERVDIIGGGTPPTSNKSYWNGNINWFTPLEINDDIFYSKSEKTISIDGLNNSSAKLLPIRTILFTSRASIGKTGILLEESCTNQGFQSFVPIKNKSFYYYIFTISQIVRDKTRLISNGSTFNEVSGKELSKIILHWPISYSEQTKIGNFFKELDNLITLHQRNLKKLENIKKSCLNKMFV